MRSLVVLAVLAAGCTGDKAPDDTSGGDDTSDTSTDSGDSGDTAACNTDNEACAPGVAGCGGEGANMLPGSDCLSCHRRGGADEAPEWSVGGTVFSDLLGTAGAAGVRVIVTDSTGTSVTLTSGSVGNFYTSERLTPPFTASVETNDGTLTMASEVSTGACNSCHNCDGGAGGKLYAP